MMNSNTLENELNATRIKLYEQTKDMTREERVAYIHDRATETLKAHGINAVYADNVQ